MSADLDALDTSLGLLRRDPKATQLTKRFALSATTAIHDLDSEIEAIPHGATGPPGPQGDRGDTGAPGATGPNGAAGLTGAAGETGARGPQGVQGDKGDKGEPGATEGNPGPQGPAGDPGATGDQGPKGDTGATGTAGAQGPQGVKGDTGAQGIQGLQGPPGQQGPSGTTSGTAPTDARVVLPGQSIQAAIDAAPSGALIRLAAGVHKPSAPLDTSAKSALRFEGEGGVGYNESDSWGTVIRPTHGGPCFVDLGAGSEVKHAGPTFCHLNIRSDVVGSTAFKFRNVNHVKIVDCSILGMYGRAIDGDVPLVDSKGQEIVANRGGDHAYNTLERVWIVNSQPNAVGFALGDGFWWLHAVNFDMTGTSPIALQNLRGNISASQVKSNNAGTHFYSSGNSCSITDWHFEQAPYTGAFIVVCEQGANTLPGAGSRHIFMSCHATPHSDAYVPGAKIVRFGAGTFGNSWPRTLNSAAWDKPVGSFVDESGQNSFGP